MENQEKTRIQPKIFILFVIIGLLPMAVGSIILLSGARETYQDVIGGHLSVVAENAQMELNSYFRRVADELKSLALTPEIRARVYESNQKGLEANVDRNRVEWTNGDVQKSEFIRSVLENDTARFLREFTLDSSLRELLVTDAFGRTVAATHRNQDYYLSDKRWWRYAFREGAGGRYIGDFTYDDKSGMYAMEFAVPIVDRTNQRAVGVVRAIVDSEEIINLVNSIKVGQRGHALLLRGDSVILVSPEATFKDLRRFKHFAALQNAIENGNRSLQIDDGDDRLFLGFPPFKLKDSLPELDWYLAVAQPRKEALALFNNINTKFFYIVLFTVVIVGVMSVFFSWILVKPIIETDPHLERL
ncbi:MAG: hypothetical protein EHM61_18980 [Acidobacteria bacterium]|nr:MAG: hypothetical protein EHM61_18980 [Acidobacteriota bacterium]